MKRISILTVLVLAACSADSTVSVPDGPGGKADNPNGTEDLRCTYSESAWALEHEDLREEGTFAIDKKTIKFVDPSRETAENDWYWGADDRTLKTDIYYPAKGGFHIFGDRAVSAEGPFPLIIYSHGYSSSKEEAKSVAEHLASHGYIVAAPSFPLSNMLAPGGATYSDLVNQPGDVSFVIDQMLAKSRLADDEFYGAVDEERIGTMGLSLGGFTTYLVTFHPWMADDRIKAAVSLAGPASLFDTAFYHFSPTPLLIVHGDIDAFIYYEDNARAAFERSAPNSNLVTIVNGSHTGFGSMGPQFMMDIIADFVAEEGAHPDNPDRLGCGVVGDRISGQAENDDGSLLNGLGGAEQGILVPENMDEATEALPCQGDLVSLPAISTDAQLDITKRATLAFFQGYFAADEYDREDGCYYLNEVLGTDDDVVFE
jgi:dienelactone hydrolase